MIKTYFINSTVALYDDSEFATLQSAIFDAGVLADRVGLLGLAVVQNGTPNMSVNVGTGKALVEITKAGRTFKVFVENDATVNVPIAANSSGSNRVDAIVVRVNVSLDPNISKSNIGTIERVAGSGVSALSDGAITTALGSDGWIRLANVTVANADTSIVNAEIADTRARIELNDAIHITLDALSQLDTTQDAVDQSQLSFSTSSKVGEADVTTARAKVAQSFIPTRKGVRGFRFYKKANTGTFTGDIVFTLQADSSGAPSGTPLATYTMTNAEYLLIANDSIFEVEFSTQYPSFVAGATYWIVATPSTNDNSNYANFGAQGSNPYANGTLKYFNTTDGWTIVTNTDLYFEIIELTSSQVVKTDANGVIPATLLAKKKTRLYTIPGTYTWIKEGAVVLVEVWGAGGAGGGRDTGGTSTRYGAGGGGGAYMSKIFDCATLPASITVTVGQGGTPSGSGGSGAAGTNSQFNNNAFPDNYGGGGEGYNGWGGAGGGATGIGDSPTPSHGTGNNADSTLSAAQKATYVPYGMRNTNQSFRGFCHGIYSGAGGSGNSTNQDQQYGGNSVFGGGGGGGNGASVPGGTSRFAGNGGNTADGAGSLGQNGYAPSGGGGAGGGTNTVARVAGYGAHGQVRITVL